jgi:parvulin-like peptidyl-prolyl isomerase
MGQRLNPKKSVSERLIHQFLSNSTLYILAIILVTITSCTSQKNEVHRDFKVLFKVNGVERTVYDFESAYVEHLITTGKNDTRDERNGFLNKLIDEILLAQSAVDKSLLNHHIYKSAIQYQQRKSMIDFYFVDQMEEEIEQLTDDEIRLAYAKRQRKVFIRQLYSKNPEDLNKAYEELQQGKNFVDVANQFYQTSVYDSLAGYLGPISYFGVDDVIAEAAYSTNQGKYTEPIRSRLGYHILYVEYIEFPALLAEDEYQYRKQGVESQLRLRRQRLVSNDYVFELMSSLSVQTNQENILELRNVISNLDGDAILRENQSMENEETIWTDDRIRQLEMSVNGEMVLATYEFEGNNESFTVSDYLNWLPYLSFQESKVRLGASIGRGLRNHVLHQLASKSEYNSDARVQNKVEKRGMEVLSELNQYELTMNAVLDTSHIEVPESFRSKFISDRDLLMKAEYWMIFASDLEEANEIKDSILNGEDPSTFEDIIQQNYGVLDKNESEYPLVRKSLLNTPLIGFMEEEGWVVIQVLERDIEEITSKTKISDLERSYKVYKAIQSEIDSLKKEADIYIDEDLFDEIYNVWSPTN